MLNALVGMVASSRDDATATEIAEAAKKIHPDLGPLIEKLSAGGLSKSGRSLRLWLVAALLLLASKCSINLDVNRAFDQIFRSSPAESQATSPQQEKKHDSKNGTRSNPAKKRT